MQDSPIICDVDVITFIESAKSNPFFHVLPIGLALFSINGRFIYCNKAYLDMFDLPEDVAGRHVSDYFLTGYRGVMECLRAREMVICPSVTNTSRLGVSLRYPLVSRTGDLRGVLVLSLSPRMGRDAVLALMDAAQTLNTWSGQCKLGVHGLCTFECMVGGSAAMKNLRRLGRRFALSQEPILIAGESGTGKELVAQSLHMASPRAGRPFISVNCAAIPHELMESELFGYDKGAFTGARAEGMKGKFELADTGTIFLDEIGELPLPVQAKLLRVLESGEIQKIAHRGALRSDFRLLCATNRDLRAMVMQHLFREDLYHRLSVFELVVPPLRERIHDLPMLVHHCISQCVGKERARGIYLDDEVLRAFQQNFWRGNVRELKNVLTYGVYALEEGENILTMRHLPVRFVREVQGSGAAGEAVQGGAGGVSGMLAEAGAHAERKILQDTLETFQYNKVKTAKALGISRSKLYRKLRERGLFSGHEKEPRENAQ